ncbi:MAG: hypothetical protein R3B45_16375 [Bdellovibrionota bacterium]
MKKRFIALILPVALLTSPAYSFWGDGGAGWAQIPYFIKILAENYKRYHQLQMMMDQAKRSDQYFKTIHQGLEDITGLINSLPIQDQGILNELRNFDQSLRKISQIYGQIPKSPEEALHRLHDQTIAESLEMVNAFKRYSRTQETNSNSLKIQGQSASPKGAARATAVSNALILESINQLIRLQSQSLKMQSEQLAMTNKGDKKSVESYQKVNDSLGKAFRNFKRQKGLIQF